jgi:hypothetical protein
MITRLNKWLDFLSNFVAHRKGLIPLISMGLILLNFILQLIPGLGWFADTNALLHFGVILAIIGFMLAWAL